MLHRTISAAVVLAGCAFALAQDLPPQNAPGDVDAPTPSPPLVISATQPAMESTDTAPGRTVLTTQPAATQPDLDALYRQAISLMRAGKWQAAVLPMAKVFFARPLDQQPRSVVLNQAILDVKLRANAARAVKNLTEYLSNQSQPDELAINVLGSALDVTGPRRGMRSSVLWQRGLTAWERGNAELEASRPDSHRWGVEWLTPERYNHLQKIRDDYKRKVENQQAVVDRAQWHVDTQIQTYQSLMNQSQAPRDVITDAQGNVIQSPGTIPGTLNTPAGTDIEGWAAAGQAQRMRPDIDAAQKQLTVEKSRLREFKSQNPRPYWPAEYPPVDPDGPTTAP